MSVGIGVGVPFGLAALAVNANAPHNTVRPLISPSSGVAGNTLSVSNGTWTGTPSPTYTYRWLRNGIAIGGATNNTYVLIDADVLQTITASVIGTNANGVQSADSSNSVVPTGTAPVNTVLPTISPSSGLNIGDTVSVTSNGTWTGTTPITYGYQWRNAGGDISGATNSSYIIQSGDMAGGYVYCRVTAYNVVSQTNADSAHATLNVLSAPSNVSAPVVSPVSAGIGVLLTSTSGTWNGNPSPSFSYQWQRSGSNIGGATSSTYTTQAADDGLNVRCVVTAINSQGSASANSNDCAVSSAEGHIFAPRLFAPRLFAPRLFG